MKPVIFLLIMIASFGCTKKYFSPFNENCFTARCKGGPPIVLYDTINLDNSYKVYKRQVCEVQTSTGLLRNNCEDLNGDGDMEKREIEYLFISNTQKRVIYITTIPSYNADLIYNTPLYEDNDLINIWDFNIFHFGQLKDNNIEFINMDGSSKYYWSYEIDKSGNFKLTEVTTESGDKMNIMVSLSFPVKFNLKEQLILSLNGKRNDRSGTHTLITPHKYILFGKSVKNARKTRNYVFFKFNETVNGSPLMKLVLFNNKRIRSLPASN